jgi:hypothetical protein
LEPSQKCFDKEDDNEQHRWGVEIYIDEGVDGGTKTVARARLHTRDKTRMTGISFARRNPNDVDVAEIGDEIAVCRALRDLADQLLNASAADVAEATHNHAELKP